MWGRVWGKTCVCSKNGIDIKGLFFRFDSSPATTALLNERYRRSLVPMSLHGRPYRRAAKRGRLAEGQRKNPLIHRRSCFRRNCDKRGGPAVLANSAPKSGSASAGSGREISRGGACPQQSLDDCARRSRRGRSIAASLTVIRYENQP